MASEVDSTVVDEPAPQPSPPEATIPSPEPNAHDVASPPPPQLNLQNAVNFFNLLTSMAADPSTAWIRQLLQDNETLKAAAERQGGINGGLTLALGQLSEDLKKATERLDHAVSESEASKARAGELASTVDDANKTIAEKDQQLQEDAAKIDGLNADVEKLDKEVKLRDEIVKQHEERQAQDSASISDLKEELGSTKDNLVTVSNQLKEIEDLQWDMGTMSKDEILSEINQIYANAKSIAINFFGADVPETVLQDAEAMATISQVFHPIPLVSTNSSSAKRARAWAFLHVLGFRLAVRIFVPVYYQVPSMADDFGVYQQDGTDISFMLSSLAEEDPKRELHLRRVLVGTAPEKQREIAHSRALDTADGIFEELIELFGGDRDREIEFVSQLRAFCLDAVARWEKLRVLGAKIEPFVDAEDTEEFWLQAEQDIGNQGQPQSPNPNGSLKRQQSSSKAGLTSKPSIHSLTAASRVTLLWPGFRWFRSPGADPEVIRQGYMLMEHHIRKLKEEMSSKRAVRAVMRGSTPHVQRRRPTRRSALAPVGAD